MQAINTLMKSLNIDPNSEQGQVMKYNLAHAIQLKDQLAKNPYINSAIMAAGNSDTARELITDFLKENPESQNDTVAQMTNVGEFTGMTVAGTVAAEMTSRTTGNVSFVGKVVKGTANAGMALNPFTSKESSDETENKTKDSNNNSSDSSSNDDTSHNTTSSDRNFSGGKTSTFNE